MSDGILTLQQYLGGKVRNITVPDDAVAAILLDVGCTGVDKDTDVTLLSLRDRELCLAWLYVWVATSLSQTGGTTDEDADWKHTEGSERMTDALRREYLRNANDIFDKYDLPLVSEDEWGFVGRGFHNPYIVKCRR